MKKLIFILLVNILFGFVYGDKFVPERLVGMSSIGIEELRGNQIDATYASNTISDSTIIKPIKFLGMKIGWKRGNKKLKENEMYIL
mgnify:CR=1 FL=1